MSFLAAAGIGALGSIISSAIGSHSAKSTSAANIEAAREAMQNKHQWEVEDLKKAGLNPIISAHGSTGTTSGSGVAFTPENPFANFAQLKIANDRAKAEINSAKAQAANTEVDTQRKQFDLARDYITLKNYIDTSNSNTARAAADLSNSLKTGQKIDAEVAGIQANTAQARALQPVIEVGGDITHTAAGYARDILGSIGEFVKKHYLDNPGKR